MEYYQRMRIGVPFECLNIIFQYFYFLGCGSVLSLDKPGKITIRGSDKKHKICRWLATPRSPAVSNNIISFHFTYFDVPCRHGHVILNARNRGKKMTFCGADPPPVTSLPASSQITVEVKLDKGSNVWGIDLNYKTDFLGNLRTDNSQNTVIFSKCMHDFIIVN